MKGTQRLIEPWPMNANDNPINDNESRHLMRIDARQSRHVERWKGESMGMTEGGKLKLN